MVKVGGPIYRIGVGGGAASSVEVQGDNKAELDFGAVQRGDAEMEQKLNRLLRACLELGQKNPILSIHDQGAGGNGGSSFLEFESGVTNLNSLSNSRYRQRTERTGRTYRSCDIYQKLHSRRSYHQRSGTVGRRIPRK